jgi:hypothetical protein
VEKKKILKKEKRYWSDFGLALVDSDLEWITGIF